MKGNEQWNYWFFFTACLLSNIQSEAIWGKIGKDISNTTLFPFDYSFVPYKIN